MHARFLEIGFAFGVETAAKCLTLQATAPAASPADAAASDATASGVSKVPPESQLVLAGSPVTVDPASTSPAVPPAKPAPAARGPATRPGFGGRTSKADLCLVCGTQRDERQKGRLCLFCVNTMRRHNKRRIEAPHVAVHACRCFGKTTCCVFQCYAHLPCLLFSPTQDLESLNFAADVKRLSLHARAACLQDPQTNIGHAA